MPEPTAPPAARAAGAWWSPPPASVPSIRCDDARVAAASGEVVSFTTLHSPPEGFRAPLHMALVEARGGGPARLPRHRHRGRQDRLPRARWKRVDYVFYFSHLGFTDRARLFWRRTGASGERVAPSARASSKACGRGDPVAKTKPRSARPSPPPARSPRPPAARPSAPRRRARHRPHPRARGPLLRDVARRHGRGGDQDRGARQG